MTRPNPHIALIYHYDLARALAGEVVDWQAIPVNVDAGREGGDLCRAAADFAKRRDLFAMPAPTIHADTVYGPQEWVPVSAVPVDPNPAVEQQAADPEPSTASTTVPGTAVDLLGDQCSTCDGEGRTMGYGITHPCERCNGTGIVSMLAPTNGEPCSDITSPITTSPSTTTTITNPSSNSTTPAPTTTAPANISTSSKLESSTESSTKNDSGTDDSRPGCTGSDGGIGRQSTDRGPNVVPSPADRDRLRARIKDLVETYPWLRDNADTSAETLIRRHWPEGVPTLKHDGHSDAQLQLILAAVRRVEAEVGAGWHPDDGPPPHVNTNPRASIEYPVAATPDEGGRADPDAIQALHDAHGKLDFEQGALVAQIATEARQAGRNLSITQNPTVRRWSIARAVIAWAASGRTLDELWFAASNLATFEQCRDPSATLGGLVSQFTIEQADRLYEAASNA